MNNKDLKHFQSNLTGRKRLLKPFCRNTSNITILPLKVNEELQKLQEWRLSNSQKKMTENGQKDSKAADFGPQITSLTNFVIKEQGKCFELARTGRELILLLREENNQDVENILTVTNKSVYFINMIFMNKYNIHSISRGMPNKACCITCFRG